MQISLFILIFTSLIGVLGLAYAYHFRNRALTLGAESLKAALSRTILKKEEDPREPSEKEWREGLDDLKMRIRRGIMIAAASFAVTLAACIAVSIAGLIHWGLSLAGVSILLACAGASLRLLSGI